MADLVVLWVTMGGPTQLMGGATHQLNPLKHFQRFLEGFRGFQEALSESLSECHFPLRVAGLVAPSRVAP